MFQYSKANNNGKSEIKNRKKKNVKHTSFKIKNNQFKM